MQPNAFSPASASPAHGNPFGAPAAKPASDPFASLLK